MKIVNDRNRINEYLKDLLVQQIFPNNVREHLSLFEFDSEEFIIDMRFDVQNLFLLVEGQAKMYVFTSNGKSLLLDFLEYPSILGEWEMKGNSPTCTVCTITPCICLGITFDNVRRFLFDNLSFWKALNEINSIKTQRQVSHCIETITSPLESRCAYFIYKNSCNNLYRVPHTEAAAYLGVSYRHMIYMINSFVKMNLLEKTTAGYRIVDSETLQRLIL